MLCCMFLIQTPKIILHPLSLLVTALIDFGKDISKKMDPERSVNAYLTTLVILARGIEYLGMEYQLCTERSCKTDWLD